jgi:hypothetical protein
MMRTNMPKSKMSDRTLGVIAHVVYVLFVALIFAVSIDLGFQMFPNGQ